MRRFLLLPAAALLVAAGCTASGSHRGSGSSSAPATAAVATAVAGGAAGGLQTVRIGADDSLRFRPSVISARPGRVAVTVTVTGGTPHTFTAQALGVDSGNIAGGSSKTVTFTVSKPGTYSFVCAYHAAAGMAGTLVVRGQ